MLMRAIRSVREEKMQRHTFERIRHFLICLRNKYVTFTLINPRKKRMHRSLLTKKTMDQEKNRINDFCYQL